LGFLNISSDEFWSTAPSLIKRTIKGKIKKIRAQAWWIGYYNNIDPKRYPMDLSKELGKFKKKTKQEHIEEYEELEKKLGKGLFDGK